LRLVRRWGRLAVAALNLPDTSVSDLVVEERSGDRHAGRSFYVLDDIGPLRNESQVTASALHLFKPREAIRHLTLPVIDYVLKTPAPEVVVEIRDSGGRVISALPATTRPIKSDRTFWQAIARPSRKADSIVSRGPAIRGREDFQGL
jgi:hypothetical protein